MSSDELEHRKELMGTLRARLWQRELQAARYGIDTPPEVLNEITDIRSEITKVQAKIVELGGAQIRLPEVTRAEELVFENQNAALNMVLRQTQANNFFIEGLAGYGKTRFLTRLAQVFDGEHWHVYPPVCFSEVQESEMSQRDAIAYIAEQFGLKVKGNSEEMGWAVALQLYDRSFSSSENNRQRRAVLILDDVDWIDLSSTNKKTSELSEFLGGLREESKAHKNYTLRLLFAGKSISQHHLVLGDGVEVNLKLFEFEHIQRIVENLFEQRKVEMTVERYHEMAQFVLYVTGGYPRMIRDALLINKTVGLVHHRPPNMISWAASRMNNIRSAVIHPNIGYISDSMPEKLWSPLRFLCVFRWINRDIIKHMMNFVKIQEFSSHIELSDELQKSRLIEHQGPVFEDVVLRPIIVRGLHHYRDFKFEEHCKIQREFILRQLLHPPQKISRSYLFANLLYIMIIEHYDSALSSDEASYREVLFSIEQVMIEQIKLLYPINALDDVQRKDTEEDLRVDLHDLHNLLIGDTEMMFLFEYIVRNTVRTYREFVQALCDVRAYREASS